MTIRPVTRVLSTSLATFAALALVGPGVTSSADAVGTAERGPGATPAVGHAVPAAEQRAAARVDLARVAREARPVTPALGAAPAVATVAAPAVAVASAPATEQHQDILLALVSERTGYPAEMLDLDLDLEADLSIDSIKRLEVIGELSQRLSLRERLGAGADALIEQLSGRKTLRAALSGVAGGGEAAEAALVAAGIDPRTRGEQLTVEQFATIAEHLP